MLYFYENVNFRVIETVGLGIPATITMKYIGTELKGISGEFLETPLFRNKPPAVIFVEPNGGDFDVPSVLLITICDPISHDFTMRTAESGEKSPRFGSANLTPSNPF